MSHREFNAQRTMLASVMATAGAELLEYMGTAGALAAIPNTDPPRYVVAGTLQIIAKLLPNVDAAPAVQAPSQVPAKLTDERIYALWKERGGDGVPAALRFARAIERELRAGSSDVRDKAPQWISVDEREPEEGQRCIVLFWPYNNHENEQIEGIANYIDGTFMNHEGDELHPPSHWMPFPSVARPAVIKAESPAASKEGGAK